MDALGPFEPRPRVAVALSGGSDSLALALLLDRWARDRGGSVLALTVDHALRPESAAEARQVGRWMEARAIPHRILRWEGPKPATGIQEAARAARYALLEQACREEGILHLALGHQADDQAETVAIRQARDSGPDGLAGMAPIRELRHVRLLRPLLGVRRAALRTVCEKFGQPWVDDPSNLSDRYARGRLRLSGRVDTDHAAMVPDAARDRAGREGEIARLLARHAAFYPEGWVELGRAALADADPGIAEGLLTRLVLAVGGGTYRPRRERVRGLLGRMRADVTTSGTLGRCLVDATAGGWRVMREPGGSARQPRSPRMGKWSGTGVSCCAAKGLRVPPSARWGTRVGARCGKSFKLLGPRTCPRRSAARCRQYGGATWSLPYPI
ncbi:tRNA lysidine(34) synthetase TilS [Aerophototrophica crusticola]|uniref:tRNA(Ile)-lysidine synthase n=1 Tax=Aerophototrophica crusticola TaxID=1709002 RepID=A0A858R8T5_9PROT|nr:tRNA lysidine(34) synthetase TilS [Rhodospirillaceae bacterium B3]